MRQNDSWVRGLGMKAAAVLAILGCTACGFVSAYNSNLATVGALLHDGFLDVKVSHTPEFPSASQAIVVSVTTSGSKSQALGSGSTGDPAGIIAKDVWTTFPYHFDSLEVNIVGQQDSTYSSSQLEATFGTRPAVLESNSLGNTVAVGWKEVYAVIGFLIALVAADVVRHEVRKRRNHRDRLQEQSLSHQHLHAGAHELDLWSGAAGQAHQGGNQHDNWSGSHYPTQHQGAPQVAHSPAPPPQPVPHVAIPWTGHATSDQAIAVPPQHISASTFPEQANWAPPPIAYPGPPPIAYPGPPPNQG
ncbi:MAG TPA: hypothetical protein VMU77_04905 [Acidimicrobiales bacterium]|nr:hypothetical protein [Acidimicrobiales bacterium]